MADPRKFIERASHNVENEMLGSAFKLAKVIQASKKAAAKKDDDEETQKRAA
jgi:hypothetical protein